MLSRCKSRGEPVRAVREDGINLPDNRPKGLIDSPARIGPNSLTEHYAAGSLSIHLHLFLKAPISDFEGNNLCVIFHRNPQLRMENQFGLDGLEFGEVSPCEREPELPRRIWPVDNSGIRDQQQAMFVGVVKFVEQPKGMRLGTIPSMIWLQTLDKCSLSHREVPNASRPIAVIERTVGKDGKLRFVIRRGSLAQCKLPSHMVKSTTQTVSDFPDQDCPLNRRRFQYFDPEYALSGLLVEFRHEGTTIRLVEPLDAVIQGFEMIASSGELESGTIKWMHMLYSKHGERQEHEDAKDAQRPRHTHTKPRGFPKEPRPSGENPQETLTASTLSEPKLGTERGHRRGDYTAKHTRLGSPEDA